jgi:hypothetical protein
LLWNYNRTRDLLAARNPSALRFLWTMTEAGYIMDYARYAILTELGGVYADTDVQMNASSLDQLLQCEKNYTFALTFEGRKSCEQQE